MKAEMPSGQGQTSDVWNFACYGIWGQVMGMWGSSGCGLRKIIVLTMGLRKKTCIQNMLTS